MKKVLCCLLMLVLLLSGCGKSGSEKVEMGELCPFSYETKRDGSVELVMETAALDGFYWQVDMQSGEVCELIQSSEGTLVTYTLKGLAEGMEIIYFLCRESEEENAYERFEMQMLVSVAQDLSVTVDTVDYTDYSVGSSGEGSDYYYAWRQDAEGNLLFTFQSNNDIHWMADCDEEAIELGAIMAGFEKKILTVIPRAEGEATVTLTSSTPPQKLVVTFAVDNMQKITVTAVDTSGIRDGAMISPRPMDDETLEEEDTGVGLESTPELNAPPDDGPSWGFGWPGEEEEAEEPAPVTPAEPAAPVTPAAPVAPVTPAEPAAPVTPAAPVAPVAPAEPAAPVTPAAPAAPVTPAEPAAPAAPATPTAPAAPAESAELQQALEELAKAIEELPTEVAGNG